MLHNHSRFLKEAAARIFFWVMASVARCRPKIAFLENVLGILRIWNKATRFSFRTIFTVWVEFDPLGSIYFLGLQSEHKDPEVWKILRKLEKHGYLVGKIIVDPIYLGDVQKRRRVYILAIHQSVLRSDITTHRALESCLENTLEKMQATVVPKFPEPTLGFPLEICFAVSC